MIAVIVSVFLMIVLSMLRVNVLLSILIAALSAGLIMGLSIMDSMNMLISGMSGQAETAISIILLGVFAVAIKYTGITGILVNKLLRFMKGKRGTILLTIAGLSCFSQNLVPVHIAFIPILIPPLLHLFDQMKIDRRGVAAALTFGLKAPYLVIPAGYGLMYHQIIATEMKTNGMSIAISTIPLGMIIPGLGMVAGLLFAVFVTYRKEKETGTILGGLAQSQALAETSASLEEIPFNKQHVITLMAILLALVIQIFTHSLALGALTGIIVMFLCRAVPFLKGDELVDDGMKMMGTIAFVMLIAAGYATILKDTGAINELVTLTKSFIGDNKLIAAITILLIGLLVTMGIGSSFGTIPILAAVYVPLCVSVGFSPLATAVLIGTASALGDAGSPASDSTIGPTMGLNADGRHNHIWDTCVPTFMHYNIPLFICGLIAALIL